MNKHLIDWLNGKRNYTIGKILYGQFGYDDAVKKQLAAGKTSHTEQLLLDAINNLIEVPAPEVEVVVSSHEVMPDDKDGVLQSLKDKWMSIYTEMNYKRHALDKLLEDSFEQSGMQRGILAKDILALEQQCIAIWHQRDYYLKHKTLPGHSIDEEAVIDPFLAAKRIELLKIYIRRYKHRLKITPGDVEAANLLKQYTDELTQLKKQHG